jgi:hypothetical protein
MHQHTGELRGSGAGVATGGVEGATAVFAVWRSRQRSPPVYCAGCSILRMDSTSSTTIVVSSHGTIVHCVCQWWLSSACGGGNGGSGGPRE